MSIFTSHHAGADPRPAILPLASNTLSILLHLASSTRSPLSSLTQRPSVPPLASGTQSTQPSITQRSGTRRLASGAPSTQPAPSHVSGMSPPKLKFLVSPSVRFASVNNVWDAWQLFGLWYIPRIAMLSEVRNRPRLPPNRKDLGLLNASGGQPDGTSMLPRSRTPAAIHRTLTSAPFIHQNRRDWLFPFIPSGSRYKWRYIFWPPKPKARLPGSAVVQRLEAGFPGPGFIRHSKGDDGTDVLMHHLLAPVLSHGWRAVLTVHVQAARLVHLYGEIHARCEVSRQPVHTGYPSMHHADPRTENRNAAALPGRLDYTGLALALHEDQAFYYMSPGCPIPSPPPSRFYYQPHKNDDELSPEEVAHSPLSHP
ncbi:hypothetical protein ACJZ2D_007923 [Fusarium nematophilum]